MNKKQIFISLCLSLMLALVMPLHTYAQNRNISGRVVGDDGKAVAGATVMIAGSFVGTTTDSNGKFSISMPADGQLEISYIGYTPKLITDFSNLDNITLKEDAIGIEDVVVVGYGTQRMKNITGAVETVAPAEISDLSVSNLGSALSGMVGGLSVSGGNARPGESSTLSIRQASVTSAYSPHGGSSSPLYVIDDYIADENAFNNLDVSVVESITVLKDAAAAVYGARSAQGVILVKTKRGHVGAPKISYSGQFGLTDEVKRAKMLNAYDYGTIWNGVRGASIASSSSLDKRTELFQADELQAMRGLNYDLLDEEWRAAFTHKHSVNISGGSERATYFAGVSYYNQDGNLGKLDYNRWNYRAGVDARIGKWIKASLQVSGDYGKQSTALNKVGGSSAETDYNYLLTHPRYIPDYVNGMPMASYGVSNTALHTLQNYNFRELQELDNYSKTMSQSMNINASLEHDFGWSRALKGLKAKVTYSKNIATSKNNQLATNLTVYKMINRGGSGEHLYTGDDIDTSRSNFQAVTVSNGNSLRRYTSQTDNYQLNFVLTYARTFGDHNISGLFTAERAESETEDLEGIVLDPLPFTDGQSSSANGTQTTTFKRSESGMLSYVGRINYSYADKYMLEALIRTDASTKFAPENYWGVFPSVSAGWVISEENWFNKSKAVDFLKVRGSFGLLGRDNIRSWGWLQLYNLDANKGGVFGNSVSNNIGSGAQSADAPNRDAHWDKSYKVNFGVDMRMLRSRLSIGLDAYYDFNRDIFMTRDGAENFPATVGTKPTAENFGAIDTYGVELSLGWRDRIGSDFKYHVRLNTGYSDNRMREKFWPSRIRINEQHKNQRTDLGEWGLECIGMFRSYQDIEEYFDKYQITNYLGMTKDDVRPGMLIYKDVRGSQNADGSYNAPDGIVDKENDLVKISNRSNPYGFTINFGGEWKGLSFSAQFGANWGGYSFIPKTARSIQNAIHSSGNYQDMEYTNLPSFWAGNMFVYEDVLDYNGNIVAAANRDAKYPNLRYSLNNETSTFWKVSGTRIMLRNITVAYAFPKAWLDKIGIAACRVNFTVQNVINFYNPYPDNFMSPMSGTYGNYPNLRKYSLGVNVSF